MAITKTDGEWRHFTPGELKVIATIAYAYPGEMDGFTKEVAVRGAKGQPDVYRFVRFFREHQQKSNFQPFDRYILAVRELAKIMAEQNRTFLIAEFDFATNRVKSDAVLDPKQTAASKEIYEKLINWDESYLREISKEDGPFAKYVEQLNLKRSAPVPIMAEMTSGSDIDQFLEKLTGTPPPADNLPPSLPRRGPGRPKSGIPED